MRRDRWITVLQGLALVASGCRPAAPPVTPVVRDYMASCPEQARQGAPCAQLSATCTRGYSMCSPMPPPTGAPDEQPIPPRCSGHEMRCACVSVAGADAPAWSCQSQLVHPAGPQPPPELSRTA